MWGIKSSIKNEPIAQNFFLHLSKVYDILKKSKSSNYSKVYFLFSKSLLKNPKKCIPAGIDQDRFYSLRVRDVFDPSQKEREMPMSEKGKNDLPVANRCYRDTVFRMLFREKKELLSLFNAIHGTSYEDPDEPEITTLENAVYMTMKNDLSCILGMNLDLYEHQSTVNPNMPLRDLFYVAKLLENHTKDQDLYSGKRIILPVPKFIVFYNGRKKQPETVTYQLSDSFARKGKEVNLELVVLQININPGFNVELVQSCPTLFEYIRYTNRVRQ